MSREVIEKEIEAARKRLLDLTMRNRLLNYRPSKAKTLKIVDELPSQVYKILVQDNKVMDFKARLKKQSEVAQQELDDDDDGLTTEESAKLWQVPTRGNGLDARHTDKYLDTLLDPESLQKRLFKIHSLAASFFEEQGYSVLFLALGFLKWRETTTSEFHNAPLVLVPVELTRQRVGAPFRIQWTGDEVLGNISLIEKLKEQMVALPAFEMPDDEDSLDTFYKKVVRTTKQMDGWQIINDVAIDFFSFTKFILWRDLDKKSWPQGQGPAEHALIKLLLDSEATTDTIEPFPEEEADERLSPEKIFHIVDADPSQIAVMEDVKAGVNLVVEGPPGTGKSQTITNTIAELLANNKSVLFVSEKMAALEVVKARLDHAGLGDYCLELHSRNTKKKEFIQELRRCVEMPPVRKATDPYQFQKLELLRKQLNDYVTALRTPIGGLGKTPYQLFSMKERVLRHFIEVDRNMPSLPLSTVEQTSTETWDESMSKLKDLTLRLKLVEPLGEHPWRKADPGLLLPEDIRAVGEVLSRCIDKHDLLSESLQTLVELSGIVYPTFLEDVKGALTAAEVIARSVTNEKNVLLNAEWNATSPDAEKLINSVKKFQELRSSFGHNDWTWVASSDNIEDARKLHSDCVQAWSQYEKYVSDICTRTGVRAPQSFFEVEPVVEAARLVLEAPDVSTEILRSDLWDDGFQLGKQAITDIERCQEKRRVVEYVFSGDTLSGDNMSIAQEYLSLRPKWYRYIQPRFYSLRKQIRRWFSDQGLAKQLPVSELEKLVEYYETKARINKQEDRLAKAFDKFWHGEFSDVSALITYSNWITAYRAAFLSSYLTDMAHECCQERSARQAGSVNCDAVISCSNRLICEFRDIEDLLGRKTLSLAGHNIEDLDRDRVPHLLQIIEDWIYIRQSAAQGRNLFGRLWNFEDSKPTELRTFASWIIEFRQEMLKGLLSERACNLVDEGALRQDILAEILVTRKLKENLDNELSALEAYVGTGTLDRLANGVMLNMSLLIQVLHTWRSSLDSLVEWSNFCQVRRSCIGPLSEPVIELLSSGREINADDIIPMVEGNYADTMIRIAMLSRPVLAEFSGEVHESRVHEFATTDRSLIEINKARVRTLLSGQKPQIYKNSAPNSQAGILVDQFNKQRKLLPIRSIMSSCGGLVQRIKPCFMMSPLSIAQFLDPQTIKFDVIVFDEASQVKPEDALGALMRGNQLVVMGDTRQLPPTSFFDHVTEDEPDDEATPEATSVTEVESILHQCKRKVPTRMLTWHYRSRHDSLIAVSNTYFYDNQLQVFPAPGSRAPGIGLHHVHSPETTYDRGKSSVNQGEAILVARAAIAHFRTDPAKSLGVGTFNIKQQEAIKQQIEIACRADPSIVEYFSPSRDDHFFVKNLETIQGDERDTIFISVGYGSDTNGKLSKNFGPLNQDGGERRLNVLTTRAREHCVVYSNFRAQDLMVDESDSRGVRALKAYLDYAESGVMPQIAEFRSDSDSPFEDSVYDFLVSHGYDIRKQVGCARYWIDLAVVNPAAPGTYLLGIECDGALYHTSRVARERDRLRQQVLEGLGWSLYRIWSTDWYRNRAHTQRRLREAIETAKLGIKSGRTLVRHNHALPRGFESLDEQAPGDDALSIDTVTEALDDSTMPELERYQMCESIVLPVGCPLHELAPREISRAVVQIINVESPVHIEEVVQRIRTLCGFSRAGQRMQDAIKAGISFAVGGKHLRQQGHFLLAKEDQPVRARRRTSNLDVNWVCDAEFNEFFRVILRAQYAMPKEELVIQTARYMGFQRTSDEISEKILLALKRAIRAGVVVIRQNASVDLP